MVDHPSKSQNEVLLVRDRSLEDFAERLDIKKIFRGILRRSWLIVLFAIAFAIGFGYLAHRLGSRYVASAYLLYESEEGSSKGSEAVFPVSRFTKASAVEMVTLSSYLNAVKSILGLELSDSQIGHLVEVVPPPVDSNLINIKVTADSPSLAMDIANTLASVVVKNSKDYTKRQLDTSYEYYKNTLDALQMRLGDKIKEIAQFQKNYPSFEYGSNGAIAIKSLSDLQLRRQTAIEQYNSQLIQYENLRREAERIPDQIVKYNETDNPLKQRLSQSELSLIEAKTRYAPENPKLKMLEAEVAQLKKLVHDPEQQAAATSNSSHGTEYQKNPLKEQLNLELLDLRGKLRSAQKLKEDIESELEKRSKELVSLPEEQVSFTRLLNSRDELESEIRSTQAILKMADALRSVGKSGLEVYLNADKAELNSSTLVRLLPLIGFILGAGLGLISALVIELSDRRLRTPLDVEHAFNLRCLTTIPEFHFFSPSNGMIQLQYFIRNLEEHIEKATSNQMPFSLTIASSIDGEGKSTIAFFLANYYSLLEKRCVVMELDGQSKYFGAVPTSSTKSFEDYLRSEAAVDDIIIRESIDRVQSVGDPNLKELLKNGRLRQLLDELKQRYDVVLIDAPGLVKTDYAVNISEQSDFNLFVIGSTTTPLHIIDISLRELEIRDIKPIGAVLNRALRIYLDDVRIKAYAKRSKLGIFTRLRSWISER